MGIIWLDMNLFNSFERKKHKQMSKLNFLLIMLNMLFLEKFTQLWQKFYTAVGSDGSDTSGKGQFCHTIKKNSTHSHKNLKFRQVRCHFCHKIENSTHLGEFDFSQGVSSMLQLLVSLCTVRDSAFFLTMFKTPLFTFIANYLPSDHP